MINDEEKNVLTVSCIFTCLQVTMVTMTPYSHKHLKSLLKGENTIA